jgi:hypothetical protein
MGVQHQAATNHIPIPIPLWFHGTIWPFKVMWMSGKLPGKCKIVLWVFANAVWIWRIVVKWWLIAASRKSNAKITELINFVKLHCNPHKRSKSPVRPWGLWFDFKIIDDCAENWKSFQSISILFSFCVDFESIRWDPDALGFGGFPAIFWWIS